MLVVTLHPSGLQKGIIHDAKLVFTPNLHSEDQVFEGAP